MPGGKRANGKKPNPAQSRLFDKTPNLPILVPLIDRGPSAGPPHEYQPDFCNVVEDLGRKGYSDAQMASALDVCRQTLYNWMDEHPEFGAAMRRAKSFSLGWWESIGQAALTAPEFNAGLWAKCIGGRFRREYGNESGKGEPEGLGKPKEQAVVPMPSVAELEKMGEAEFAALYEETLRARAANSGR